MAAPAAESNGNRPPARAWAGAPFAAFFAQQTSVILHRGRAAWSRTVFFGFFAAVLIFTGEFIPKFSLMFSAPGLYAFMTLGGLNVYASLGLLGVFSVAVAGLREAGVLDLLRITALSPAALVSGLCLSMLARTVLLLTAQLPLLLFCVPLGGVSYHSVFGAYLYAIALLFFLCPFCVYWSVVSKSGQRAATYTFLALAAYFVGLQVLVVLGSPGRLGFPSWLNDGFVWIRAQNPVFTFATILQDRPWPASSFLFHFLAGAFFLGLAIFRFEAACERREAIDLPGSTTAPALLVARPPRPPRVDERPLAWREFHFAGGGSSSQVGRWLLYLLFTGVFSLLSADLGKGLLLTAAFGLLFDVPRMLAQLLGSEVRDHTLGDLAILPMSPWNILGEKLRGRIPALIPAFATLLAGLLVELLSFESYRNLDQELLICAYLGVQFALLVALAVYISLVQPATSFAASLVCVLVYNWILLGIFMNIRSLPLVLRLLVPTLIALWVIVALVRVFPTTFYRTAAR